MTRKTFLNAGILVMLFLLYSFIPAHAQINRPAVRDTSSGKSKPKPGSFTRNAKGKIDSYTTLSGRTFKLGDTIRLLTPKRIEQTYSNIEVAIIKKHLGDGGKKMEGKYSMQQFLIEAMDNSGGIFGNGPANMYFFIKVRGIFGGLYQINIEPALMQGEVE